MKRYTILAPGDMWKNIVNALLGASWAMKAVSADFRLHTTHASADAIYFETNSDNFAHRYITELSNYNIRVEQTH